MSFYGAGGIALIIEAATLKAILLLLCNSVKSSVKTAEITAFPSDIMVTRLLYYQGCYSVVVYTSKLSTLPYRG